MTHPLSQAILPPTETAPVRGLVFGFEPGDLHRAGRADRSLSSRGVIVENAPALTIPALATRLRETPEPLFLLRSGAWFVDEASLEHFPASATGRALVGIGAVRDRVPFDGGRDDLAEAWSRWLGWTGGDPECGSRRLTGKLIGRLASRLASAWRPRHLPPVASCYVEIPVARLLAEYLETEGCFDRAMGKLIGDPRARTVHLSALDAYADSACRVLQLVTTIQIGGAERVTLDLAEELSWQGHHVCVAALSLPTRLAFPRPGNFADLSGTPREPRERGRAVAELARGFGADLVHAHLIRVEEGRAIKAEGLPLVMTVHNSQPGWPSGLAHADEKDADFLFACAQSVERELTARELGIPVRTVWNGIRPEPFHAAPAGSKAGAAWRAARGWNEGDFVMTALANPRPQKRLHLLPEIVHELQRLLPDRMVRLILAGAHEEGSAEALAAVAATKAEIAKWAVENQVFWTGGIEDVATILAASDLLISVSAHEGLSLAHLEALAAGVPVVATEVGGAAEIAGQGQGMRLIPPGASAREIAGTIVSLHGSWNREASGLPASFHRRQMAARAARLYPRVIERSRGIISGGEVWLITNNFSTGGAQSSARRLLMGLAARGHKVRALTVQEFSAHPTPGRSALLQARIPVTSFPPPEMLDAADAAGQILELAARERPRAVLFWNLIASYKIFLADGLIDVPIYDVSPGGMYFTSLAQYFAHPRPGMPYLNPREYGARLAAVVVKYAAEVSDAAVLGAPVKVIRNGVDVSERCKQKSTEAQPWLVIGTAARISPDKRIEDLIDALRIAHPRLPRYVLRIAGGVERGAENYGRMLRKRARGLCVEWLGELLDSQQFLSGLDIFTMISEPAGCPNASLEAMTAGLPVIATDVGGAGEQVIDGRNGRLLPRGDAAGFAEALVELADDPVLRERMGLTSAAHVRAHFSLEAMIGNYERLCSGGVEESRMPVFKDREAGLSCQMASECRGHRLPGSDL